MNHRDVFPRVLALFFFSWATTIEVEAQPLHQTLAAER